MSCICMTLYLRTLLPSPLPVPFPSPSFRPFNPVSNYTCSATIGPSLAQVIIILLSYQRYCHSWTHTTIALFEVLGLVRNRSYAKRAFPSPLPLSQMSSRSSFEGERRRDRGERLDNGFVFVNWQLAENLMELCCIVNAEHIFSTTTRKLRSIHIVFVCVCTVYVIHLILKIYTYTAYKSFTCFQHSV